MMRWPMLETGQWMMPGHVWCSLVKSGTLVPNRSVYVAGRGCRMTDRRSCREMGYAWGSSKWRQTIRRIQVDYDLSFLFFFAEKWSTALETK
jgi:hypothetical protein